MAPNDHVHNRLTHSIEVGQVGRALALKAHKALKGQFEKLQTASDLAAIVQAACLAHDIGNPPFGHAGEEAMTAWLNNYSPEGASLTGEEKRDLVSFEGNAQGFRVIAQLENHLFDGGMRLTLATLGTFLKYPYTADASAKMFGTEVGESKFSVFHAEREILEEVASTLRLPRQGEGFARHPLAYLVEAADDICYCVLDLEDAVELRIISYDDVQEMLFACVEARTVNEIRKSLRPGMFRVNFSRMRGRVFAALIDAAVEGFCMRYDDIMSGNVIDKSTDGRRSQASLFDVLAEDDPRAQFIRNSKRIARRHIYSDVKKVEVELGAFATLETLLAELCEAAVACSRPDKLAWKSRRILELMGDHAPVHRSQEWPAYACLRRAVDFVSGCTDNYATYLGKQLRGDAFTGIQRP